MAMINLGEKSLENEDLLGSLLYAVSVERELPPRVLPLLEEVTLHHLATCTLCQGILTVYASAHDRCLDKANAFIERLREELIADPNFAPKLDAIQKATEETEALRQLVGEDTLIELNEKLTRANNQLLLNLKWLNALKNHFKEILI